MAVRAQMSSSEVIANYELLAALHGQMRVAAAQGEWDQLINIEQQSSQLLATMKLLDAAVKLDAVAHRRKLQLIEKILADDVETRKHTQVWMDQLQLSMHSNRQERRLRLAYGG